MTTRREVLGTLGTAGVAALGTGFVSAQPKEPADKVYRIGVISARINGKPQPFNGHTWFFAQYFHPKIDLNAIEKNAGKPMAKHFEHARDPRNNFGVLPFPDTKITHYYERDPKIAALYAGAFPGVEVATDLKEMAKSVDAVWLGDASGKGEDHFDLIAPFLERGIPTFCDKPIGGTIKGVRQILDFAKRHNAPIMSSSIFRHEWGTEEALRRKKSGEFGELQYVIASMYGGYSPEGWFVYGQHPAWMIETICGSGVEAVSAYARGNTCHALLTYPDRMPGEIWYGRPDIIRDYNRTTVAFTKERFEFTPAIEGSFAVGHHYEMFNMANAFRGMIKTRVEAVPTNEILEVTAILYAGAKSLEEKGRLVKLEEVLA
ncbi:MAG: Gfo/Idh/MocA family oxidoreductase [Planctomycetes bacterium]|nr:Gfo/Idh/MocA family oxidoreductase [Planctomycetota bacterium]